MRSPAAGTSTAGHALTSSAHQHFSLDKQMVAARMKNSMHIDC